ncbi:hypothetical protein Vadar_018733 [Vaccinium darrowii]|uniref:Uncharacterized protein n=1 Tax=Vaccinium darrowii TaxID=229202 RepID=A0ACB7YE86_9ERIC|nr:hypothetical protein Vadar_018733 [Vaccinium darrowii]
MPSRDAYLQLRDDYLQLRDAFFFVCNSKFPTKLTYLQLRNAFFLVIFVCAMFNSLESISPVDNMPAPGWGVYVSSGSFQWMGRWRLYWEDIKVFSMFYLFEGKSECDIFSQNQEDKELLSIIDHLNGSTAAHSGRKTTGETSDVIGMWIEITWAKAVVICLLLSVNLLFSSQITWPHVGQVYEQGEPTGNMERRIGLEDLQGQFGHTREDGRTTNRGREGRVREEIVWASGPDVGGLTTNRGREIGLEDLQGQFGRTREDGRTANRGREGRVREAIALGSMPDAGGLTPNRGREIGLEDLQGQFGRTREDGRTTNRGREVGILLVNAQASMPDAGGLTTNRGREIGLEDLQGQFGRTREDGRTTNRGREGGIREMIALGSMPDAGGLTPNRGMEIGLEDLQGQFGRTRKDAAAKLRVSVSTFKRKCREHGIVRWPDAKKIGDTIRDIFDGEIDWSIENDSIAETSETPTIVPVIDQSAMSIVYRNPNPLLSVQPQMPLTQMGSENLGGPLVSMQPRVTQMASENLGSPLVSLQPQVPWTQMASDNLGSFDDGRTYLALQAQQDTWFVMIKAMYGKDTILLFPFLVASGIIGLKGEVSKRLKFEVDSFDIKYEDDDERQSASKFPCFTAMISYLFGSISFLNHNDTDMVACRYLKRLDRKVKKSVSGGLVRGSYG